MPHRKGRKRRYSPQVSVGVIQVAQKGYGFVDTPEGEYFILQSKMHGAMDGDLVEVVRLCALEQKRRDRYVQDWKLPRRERGRDRERLGAVRRVLERAHSTIVGTLIERDGLRFVRPHDARIDYDIFLDRQAVSKPASDGDVVVVRLSTYPSRLEAATGYLEEVVGHEDEQGIDIEVIIRTHGFETVFSAAALEEAAALAASALDDGALAASALSDKASGDTMAGGRKDRRDLRERFVFTIDPADARDFDDALSLDYLDGQMRLGVHIADVSAYVPWGSALDLNARRRATSVYLPDRVIPMLPPKLSDDLCSLRPGADRLAFTIDMMMNNDGSVAASKCYPSLIHSAQRLTYEQAQAILEDPTHHDFSSSPLAARLHALNRLAHARARRRRQQGALDFASIEAKLTLDADGVPSAVHLRRKTDATALVEEAMIVANEQIARFMLARELPMIYRIHEAPSPGALEELLPTLQEFGYAHHEAPQTSRAIQGILDESVEKPEHALISQLLLRAMKRARYAPHWLGHFGLASGAYTHFTSPIRRYPDLMAHRLLKLALLTSEEHLEEASTACSCPRPEEQPGAEADEPSGEQQDREAQCLLLEEMATQLAQIAEHSSNQEREAEAAAREATALKLAEYLSAHVGERFSVQVVGLTTTGIYVREETTTAEGFIAVRDLPEGLRYEPERHRYRDPETGAACRLGMTLSALLSEVERPSMRLRFVIA